MDIKFNVNGDLVGLKLLGNHYKKDFLPKNSKPMLEGVKDLDAYQGIKFGFLEGHDSIFEVVEEPPSFPGGVAKFYEFLSKQLRYPEMAKENGIQGKVFVQFVVCKDGSIKDVKVIKSIHNTLDKEASRVVKRMPKWSPGKQRGKAVNTKFTLPIKFKIS